MISLDIHKIQEYLKSKDIQVQYQQETNQLYILFKVAEQEFPLFLRIFEGDELLQLLAFLPCHTKESTLNDTARLLHLLNKELDVPGFGMDESSSIVFYRTMIPVQKKEIEPLLLDAYINAIQIVCKTFASVIAAVSYGAITFEDVLKKAKEDNKQSFTQSKLKKSV